MGLFVPRGGHYSTAFFNTSDWRFRGSDGGRVLCNRTGEIAIPVEYFPNGANLSLDLKAVGPYARMPLEISLTISGQVVGQTRIQGEGRLSAVLEPTLTLPESPLDLTLSVLPRPSSLADRWMLLGAPAGLLEATGLEIEALPPAKTGFALSVGEHRDFAKIARACQATPPVDPGRPDRIEGHELVLCLTRPELAEATELVVRFQENQIAGSLVAADQFGPVYRGQIRSSSIIRIPIGMRHYPHDRVLMLTLSLDPDDAFEAPAFVLSSIGLATRGSTFEARSPMDFPIMGPGTIWRFEEDAGGTPNALGEGWTRGEAGAELFDTLGTVQFSVDPATADDAVLYMRLAPAASLPQEAPPPAVSAALLDDPPALPEEAISHMRPVPAPPRQDHPPLAVAVTTGDEVLAQVLLEGEHEFAVPLSGVLAKGKRQVELAVHAALPVGAGLDIQLDRGGLVLRSLRLSAETRQPFAPRAAAHRAGRTLSGDIEAAAEQARKLRAPDEKSDPPEVTELVSLHRDIVATVRSLAGSAVLPVLLNDETLSCLCDIGEAVSEAGENPGALRSDAERAGLFSADPVEAVRSAALAILTAPPWQALAGHTPDDLPEMLRAFPSQLARYLCSLSHEVPTADDLEFLSQTCRDAARLCAHSLRTRASAAAGTKGLPERYSGN